jgi:hypothetical protein
MVQLVLTDEQAKVVSAAFQPIQVCDSQGRIIGHIKPVWTEEDIKEALRIRETETEWHTTEQVLARLKSLEDNH